jgi:carbamoyl-phosphate synthase large subunit
MGVGHTFAEAFVKSQLGAGVKLPTEGGAFISVKGSDKSRAVECAQGLHEMGFTLIATRGTAVAIAAAGLPVKSVHKIQEGRPNVVDMMKNGEISLVINSVEEKRSAIADSRALRTTALAQRITYYTTIAGALAAVQGMRHVRGLEVYSVQALHRSLEGKSA